MTRAPIVTQAEYRPHLDVSLKLSEDAATSRDARLIDVGGTESMPRVYRSCRSKIWTLTAWRDYHRLVPLAQALEKKGRLLGTIVCYRALLVVDRRRALSKRGIVSCPALEEF